MSPVLENLVRPFQTGQVNPPALRQGPVAPAADDVEFQCGSPDGTIKTFTESLSSSITAYTEGQQQEVSREVIPVRVKNPDDPDQHVDMDVTTKVTVANKDGDKVTKNEVQYNKDVIGSGVNEILGGARKITDATSNGGWPGSWNK